MSILSWGILTFYLFAPSLGPLCKGQLQTSYTELKYSFIYSVVISIPHTKGSTVTSQQGYTFSGGVPPGLQVVSEVSTISLCCHSMQTAHLHMLSSFEINYFQRQFVRKSKSRENLKKKKYMFCKAYQRFAFIGGM